MLRECACACVSGGGVVYTRVCSLSSYKYMQCVWQYVVCVCVCVAVCCVCACRRQQ